MIRRTHSSTVPKSRSPKPLTSKLVTFLFFLPIIISFIGLFFVFEASSIRSLNETGDSFSYLKRQTIWIFIGMFVMAITARIDYRQLFKVAAPYMGSIIVLLVVVLLPHIGSKIGGARRWIDLGFFSLQPTEFAKSATILYLASWFSQKKASFFSFMILIGILMGLIMLQPDMGTAMIIFAISMIMYYLAGRNLQYLLYFFPIAAVAGGILVAISPYRFNRLLAFMDPTHDTGNVSYHINQIIISLNNGGLFGQGFGASRQKYMFLPEAHTDSIFAIIGEEVGFVGAVMLIGIFIFFIYNLYLVHAKSSDKFGKLLSGGIFAFFSLQIITNLSAMVNLIPLTGVPLPFISYGGSNLLTAYLLMGIMINIAKNEKI